MTMQAVTRSFATAVIALGLAAGQAQATPFSGPDSFGYTGSSIAGNLRSTSGATSIVGGDDSYTTITLPFAFSFYGNAYTQAWVSTNGILGFDMGQAGSYCCSGQAIPNTSSVDNYIAPIWMDWITGVSMETLGLAGSREFVLTWSGSEYYYGAPGYFQTILHEGSNDIEFQYGNTQDYGHTATIGIENTSGSDGLQYINGRPTGLSGTGLRIHNVPEPASLALLGLGLAGLGFSRRRKA